MARICMSINVHFNFSQIEGSFDSAEAKKCLQWMKEIGVPDVSVEAGDSHDAFFEHLRDGMVLCK